MLAGIKWLWDLCGPQSNQNEIPASISFPISQFTQSETSGTELAAGPVWPTI